MADSKGVFILMYHRVTDALSASHLTISVNKFRVQMEYLKNFCHVLSMAELVEIFTGPKDMPVSAKPQIVVTFDDGYRDNYLNALPILKELNLPATIFLITSLIGTNKTRPRYIALPSPDILNWEEVQALRQEKITVCSHTHTHPHLTELAYAEQKKEIETAINLLYNRFQDKIAREVFAYTYGEYNEDTLRVLKELGIKVALTVEEGMNTEAQDPLRLKRCWADGNFSLEEFKGIFQKAME